MARYKVVIKKSALRELKALPKKDLRRLVSAIEGLASDPRPPGSRKLSASERYRLRQGVYRVLYSIEDDKLIVHVVKVAHRREVYR